MLKKETWLYSAGFNIEKNSLNLSRIEEELDDLKNLIKKNVEFSYLHIKEILKKTSRHLYFLKSILKKIKSKGLLF